MSDDFAQPAAVQTWHYVVFQPKEVGEKSRQKHSRLTRCRLSDADASGVSQTYRRVVGGSEISQGTSNSGFAPATSNHA
jgi:hypothetical protein